MISFWYIVFVIISLDNKTKKIYKEKKNLIDEERTELRKKLNIQNDCTIKIYRTDENPFLYCVFIVNERWFD